MNKRNLLPRPAENILIVLLVSAWLTGFSPAAVSPAFAQDQADGRSVERPSTAPRTEEVAVPEEPEVELPTVVLEYSAIRQESIETELPDGDVIELPTIEELLPEAGALEVASPDLTPVSPRQPVESAVSPAAFYSEGVIGGGSDNHLIGDIALYKRGELPLYQFRFSHEGIDGYGDNAAGTGYFDRREELSGKVEFGNERHRGTVDGEYFEMETGLQDFNAANSVIHRFIQGRGTYTRTFDSPFSLSAGALAHSGSQLIGMQSEAEELYVDTHAAGIFENEHFYISFSGGHRYQQVPGDRQMHQGRAELLSKLYFDRFDITAEVGGHWDTENQFLVPWNLELDGVAGDFQYRLGGGYLIDQVLYRELWNEYPLLDTGDEINIRHGWDAYGQIGYTPNTAFRLSFDAHWNLLQGVLVPENLDARDGDTGLFPFGLDERQLLDVQTLLNYFPNESITLAAGWKGQLMGETDPLRPEHLLTGRIGYSNRTTGFGASLEGDYKIGELPEMQTQLSYLLSEGINIVLEGSDLLAPFYADGRPWWGEYEQRGLNVTLKTEISL